MSKMKENPLPRLAKAIENLRECVIEIDHLRFRQFCGIIVVYGKVYGKRKRLLGKQLEEYNDCRVVLSFRKDATLSEK